MDKDGLRPLVERMQQSIEFARSAEKRVGFSKIAGALWDEGYSALTEPALGPVGLATSRGEAQVRRLACVYALLDCSDFVKEEHLRAALEVWRYCADSARFIFGEPARNPIAEEILKELRRSTNGRTRNELRVDLFQQHKTSEEITGALELLQRSGLARMERETKMPGRPAERWYAV